MRIGLLLRDTEYRDAMIEMIAEYDRDVFAEVADASGADPGSVILTDISPAELGDEALRRIAARTVFLTPVEAYENGVSAADCEVHFAFKYSDIQRIMSEVSMVYSSWTGDRGSVSPLSRSIAVCSEYDHLCRERCMSLARQIIYRRGGSVLIIPLGFINDYGNSAGEDLFTRLMYMIDAGRPYPAGSFADTDSYGISFVRMKKGINPVSGLGKDYLGRFISGAARGYDTLILDVGTAYREENLDVISGADHILMYGSGSRTGGFAQLIGTKNAERVRVINTRGSDTDEANAVDDFVREVFGKKDGR